MKSSAGGGSPDGSAGSAMTVAQDNGADDRAATTIQAVYRGFRARKYVEAVNAAAVKIQAGFRGYRVRQSLKNAAPSTATTTTDDSQCWSDDDQKSVVSVTYAPLKEYECEPRGAGDGRGDDGDGPSAGVGGDDGVAGDGDGVDSARGDRVGASVGVSGVGIREDGGDDDDDDDDQLQTGDDEVFEPNDHDGGGSSGVGLLAAALSEPANPTEVTPDDVAEAEALVQAAVKIQARVRGFAARKRLNEEKNGGADKQ